MAPGRTLAKALRGSTSDCTVIGWAEAAIDRRHAALLSSGCSPRLEGGSALCVGAAPCADGRFLAGREETWSPADRALAALAGLESRGFRTLALTGKKATRKAILRAMQELMHQHDPESPFLLWLSGLALGHERGTLFLPWDAGWDHPAGSALDLGTLGILLRRLPHWACVLDARWPVPPDETPVASRPVPLRIPEPLPLAPRRRIALFVAVDAVPLVDGSDLPEAREEAAALAARCKGAWGFDDVRTLINPDVDSIIETVATMAAQAGADGLFLLGFTGHGLCCDEAGLPQARMLLMGHEADLGNLRVEHGLLPLSHLLLASAAAGRRGLLLHFPGGLPHRLGAPPLAQWSLADLEAFSGGSKGVLQDLSILVVQGPGSVAQALEATHHDAYLNDALSQALPQARVTGLGAAFPSLLPGITRKTAKAVLVVGRHPAARFRHIQEALEVAPPHAVLHIHPGQYHEALTLRRPVTLVHAGGPGSVCLVIPDEGAIRVLARGVRFCDLTISQNAVASGSAGGLRVEGGSLLAQRCDFYWQDSAGIEVLGPTGRGTFQECRIFGANFGLKVTEGSLATLARCLVSKSAVLAVLADQEAAVRISESHLTASLFAQEASLLEASGCTLQNPNQEHFTIVADSAGEALSRMCRFEGGRTSPLLAHSLGRLEVMNCSFGSNHKQPFWDVSDGGICLYRGNTVRPS